MIAALEGGSAHGLRIARFPPELLRSALAPETHYRLIQD